GVSQYPQHPTNLVRSVRCQGQHQVVVVLQNGAGTDSPLRLRASRVAFSSAVIRVPSEVSALLRAETVLFSDETVPLSEDTVPLSEDKVLPWLVTVLCSPLTVPPRDSNSASNSATSRSSNVLSSAAIRLVLATTSGPRSEATIS